MIDEYFYMGDPAFAEADALWAKARAELVEIVHAVAFDARAWSTEKPFFGVFIDKLDKMLGRLEKYSEIVETLKGIVPAGYLNAGAAGTLEDEDRRAIAEIVCAAASDERDWKMTRPEFAQLVHAINVWLEEGVEYREIVAALRWIVPQEMLTIPVRDEYREAVAALPGLWRAVSRTFFFAHPGENAERSLKDFEAAVEAAPLLSRKFLCRLVAAHVQHLYDCCTYDEEPDEVQAETGEMLKRIREILARDPACREEATAIRA
ncbi:hypothetical protein [Sutterella sp.]|uniref:hypothetical protein n=1 Tax=Sutterella sp. TaxID=1981025 RepID=UPI0026E004EF|nr:hypothetical protein [Sutterella sp.]MDO5532093.1 hypothetical protein [Sutterella sp.]